MGNEVKSDSISNRRLRHRAEKVFVAIGRIFIAALLLSSFVLLAADITGFEPMEENIAEDVQLILFMVLGMPFMLPFMYAYRFWKTISNSFEVTPNNYPDIYAIYKEQALKLGFEEGRIPRLYLQNGNGVMNAYTTKCGWSFRSYIVLYSDIVDLYTELGDERNADVLRFIVSHELGHVRLGHTTIRRTIMEFFMKAILLGQSLSRAQEYSADRVAASVCKQGCYARSIAALIVGKNQSKYMNIKAFCEEDAKENSLWLMAANFVSGHPVARRRVATLNQMDNEGWENVHGKMF